MTVDDSSESDSASSESSETDTTHSQEPYPNPPEYDNTYQSSDTPSTESEAAQRSEPRVRQVPDADARSAHIHDGAGHGAQSQTEDWVREHSAPESNDGRSPTRTYFDARDAPQHIPPWQYDRDPSEQRSWRTLAAWQDGAQSDISRGSQNWRADKTRWVQTFGRQMGASDYHIAHAQHVLEEIDLDTYHGPRLSTELVILGILSLIIDDDVSDWEHRSFTRDGTQQLLDDLDSDISEYRKTRRTLREYDGDLIFPDER